jgi:predicted Zn-dependent peptidase
MTFLRTPHQHSVPDETLYQKTVLENGIRVVSEYIPTVRSVSVGLWVDVGSRYETSKKNGISHFLEHMVFKGTRRRSMRQIAQSVESIGGYLNAFTTKEHTCFYARVLDEHIDRAVDVITDLVSEPVFNPKEINKEKYVVLEELKQIEDDPDDLIHDYLDRVLYHPHPLGEPIIGRSDSIRTFDRSDLFEHLEHYYTPENMVLSAAGKIDHNRLCELARKYTHKLRRRSPSERKDRLPRRKGKMLEFKRSVQQAYICMGTKAYSVHSGNRFPLLVLNSLLGEGMSSRLNQTIREKYGLAYSVYSFANFLNDTGMFGVYIGTDTKKIWTSIELTKKEFRKLQDKPVGKAELQRTLAQIKGSMMLGLENMSGRMMRIGASELYFKRYSSLDEVLKRIGNVTADNIQMVAQDLLNEENFSTVVFKPS